jgi:hypothetical protein
LPDAALTKPIRRPTLGAKFERLDDATPALVDARPAVALVPAGGALWEDFLDTIGVPLERFCAEGPGGWMLGYMDALGRAGLRTVLVFVSARVDRPARWCHRASGDLIVVLPAPAAYRALRRRAPVPGADARSGRAARWRAAAADYLSTPLGAAEREMRRERCRAVVCQEYEYFRFEACLVLGRRLGVPVFASFQGSGADPNPFGRVLRPHTIGRAAGLFIAAGREIERVRAAYGPGARTVQLFNPVDVDAWGGADRAPTATRRAPPSGSGRRRVWSCGTGGSPSTTRGSTCCSPRGRGSAASARAATCASCSWARVGTPRPSPSVWRRSTPPRWPGATST